MFSPTTQTQTQADGPGDAHAHAHSHAASRLTPRAFVAQPQSPAKPRALFANTAKTSALLMNNDESERLLNEGLAIVQEAFDRRTAVLQGELLEWRQNSLAQREQVTDSQVAVFRDSRTLQIINLENENKSLNQKLNELESIVQAQRTDLLTLSDSKNLITEKYNILKKSAAQLDSFRKSIVSMVEYGPAMASALNAMDLNQSFNLTNEHSETPLSSTTPAALANSARYSPTSRQFSMNSNPARSSPQNAIPSSYTESIPYHGSHSSHSANGVPTSPRRLINPIVGGASGGNSGDYQRMPSRNTFNNNNTNVSYLEGPSFLNANDLKSFELTSQTLDYSLAFPDRHTHMNSAHLASNAPRQATNNSDLSFIGLKQTEEPEQQPQTVQHENHSYEAEQEELQNYRQPQQQPQHQQQQQQQGQTDVSLALPPKLQPGNSNNLKLSSLSTPNLSQLGSGKGSRNNSQQQHQTGSFAGSKMAGNQIQKTLDRVNRRTTETENDSSSSTPHTTNNKWESHQQHNYRLDGGHYQIPKHSIESETAAIIFIIFIVFRGNKNANSRCGRSRS
ncbi:hypothetical protein BDR26DRAFT_921734 [Obelidium mucronatum]|nr:hypothetical protein BDR26DRAFT_921734 [Obelidium mucronatum]